MAPKTAKQLREEFKKMLKQVEARASAAKKLAAEPEKVEHLSNAGFDLGATAPKKKRQD